MRIHFIGVGGIGVSALAQYYLTKGYKVSGSDLSSSEITEVLKKKGARIFTGTHKAKNVALNTGLVIYSPAVNENNPEFREAKKRKIKLQSYPQALGELTKQHFTIAISGSHGKSTTTALISLILVKAGLDPSVIVGTKLKEFGNSNCRVGKSKYLVIEADEHFASFLNYWPKMIVLTTIEKDHLDYYKNLNNIIRTFRRYILHLPKDGTLIVNGDDRNTKIIVANCQLPIINYQLSQSKDAQKLKKILKIPGEHNIYNSLAALTVARALKVPDNVSFKALSEYKGSWRRFEIIKTRPFVLISDYGHHPTKFIVTVKAAREKYPEKKIWCVYQPHQYQRTHYLFKDFVKVFKQAPIDKIIITDIFDVAGRENKKIKKKISSEKLVRRIKRKKVIYLPVKEIVDFVKKNISDIEVLIIMGAGDIYKLIPDF